MLVLIAIAYFRGQIFKGRDARRKADINRIQIAIEEYEKDHNCYPPPDLLLCDPGTGLRPYIDKIPCDPETGEDYVYDKDPNSCAGWYRIFTNLENTSDDNITANVGPGGSYNYYASSPNAPAGQYSEGGGFYGCKGGSCVSLYWDNSRPGPECDPNYSSLNICNNYADCSSDCVPWK